MKPSKYKITIKIRNKKNKLNVIEYFFHKIKKKQNIFNLFYL